ncbi:MAG: fibronectin type III domain-containing protein [Treponema sp.]|jgi:hypothetical protein|nr:fibronectin type III domain-containing protein [Treponema sp.]
MCRTKNPVSAAVFFLSVFFILGILLSCTQVQQTLPPSAPPAPVLTGGDGLLEVSWDGVPEAHSYQVWYTANRSGQVLRSGEDISETAHTITGLTNGTLYFVCIRGVNEAGAGEESPWSRGTPSAEAPDPGPDPDPGSQETLDLDSRLTGTWRSDYNDGYVISDATLSYNDGSGYGFNFTGDIRYSKKFDSVSGVIIVEYTVPPAYAVLPGAFFGIYYWGLTPAQVYLANTSELDNNYAPSETATLEAAIAKFTQANKPKFVMESVVKPQKKQP